MEVQVLSNSRPRLRKRHAPPQFHHFYQSRCLFLFHSQLHSTMMATRQPISTVDRLDKPSSYYSAKVSLLLNFSSLADLTM